jgi:hypothetical protein
VIEHSNNISNKEALSMSMPNQELISMLRNPDSRSKVNFNHPAGESEVSLDFNEIDIEAETYTVTTITYSSVPCGDIAATIIILT